MWDSSRTVRVSTARSTRAGTSTSGTILMGLLHPARLVGSGTAPGASARSGCRPPSGARSPRRTRAPATSVFVSQVRLPCPSHRRAPWPWRGSPVEVGGSFGVAGYHPPDDPLWLLPLWPVGEAGTLYGSHLILARGRATAAGRLLPFPESHMQPMMPRAQCEPGRHTG